MRKYVIMGPQGSGKGTQAGFLCRDFGLVHINLGEILRWNVAHHTKVGSRVSRIMEEGQLVPDELAEDLVRRRLEEHDWNHGFVLDGFPRNAAQAAFFMERYDIDAVILIDLPEPAALERLLARRLCSQCGRDYNLVHRAPAMADRCDTCGGRLLRRPDDTVDAVRARLREYVDRTLPVLELFRRKERIVTVDGALSPDGVYAQLRGQLEAAVAGRVEAVAVA